MSSRHSLLRAWSARRRFLSSCSCLLAIAAGGAAADPTLDFLSEVALATDYVDRGISQTSSRPALQAGLTADTGKGWYGWLWASNIDYSGDALPDDGTWLEVDAGVGYVRQVTKALSVDLAVVRYMMPGTAPGIRYDYTEICATLGIGEWSSVTVGYSDDIHNAGAPAWHAFAGTGAALPWDATLDVGAGYFALDEAYGSAYGWGTVGITRAFGPLVARVGYARTGEAAGTIFGAAAGPRVVATLTAEFD
ncbi:MAG TPA: TorF family putative porin [Woeseiaceae bacterium]|nr:TorF family putative porin [Woeseiaceae bacterium]